MTTPFWEQPLESLDEAQWEQLCDGCSQCCLHKLQDDETEEVFATDVICRYSNCENGRCGVYAQRAIKKPDCFVIERGNKTHYSWLPKSCAYRLRAENKPLKAWHPLIAGNRKAMLAAGIFAGDWSINEKEVDEESLQNHVIFSLTKAEE